MCFALLTQPGEIDLSVNGNGPFSYSWTGPAPFINPGTEDLINLQTGTYSVSVADSNGCVATQNITVGSPAVGLSINSAVSNLQCYNDFSGSIDILITGGTLDTLQIGLVQMDLLQQRKTSSTWILGHMLFRFLTQTVVN